MTVTLAPFTTAWLGSVTVPLIVPKPASCAQRGSVKTASNDKQKSTPRKHLRSFLGVSGNEVIAFWFSSQSDSVSSR
jgi:hypothetical protein